MGQAETQILLGLSMILLAVFAAYFRPPARFLTELGLMLGLYGFVVRRRQPLMHPVYWIVVVLVTATVAVSVAVLVAELREMAVTDSLTGVLNRHGLQAMGDFVRAEALRDGSPLAVVLVDVDHFKAFNDHYGHMAGDQLLIDVARTLRDGLRAVDVVARFGGDEFALLLRDVDAETARGLLDRITPPGRHVGWSAGIATWYRCAARGGAICRRRRLVPDQAALRGSAEMSEAGSLRLRGASDSSGESGGAGRSRRPITASVARLRSTDRDCCTVVDSAPPNQQPRNTRGTAPATAQHSSPAKPGSPTPR